MNNFELHELAQQLADTHSPYKLARECIKMQETLKQCEDYLSGDKNTCVFGLGLLCMVQDSLKGLQ